MVLTILVAVLKLPHGLTDAGAATQRSMEAQYDELAQLQQRLPFRSSIGSYDVARFRAAYDESIAPTQRSGSLMKMSSADLRWLLRSAYLAYTILNDPAVFADLERDWHVIKRHKVVSSDEVFEAYEAFVSARRFADANAVFLTNHLTGMERWPRLVNRSEGSVWSVIDIENEEIAVKKDIGMEGPRIVIVSAPYCRFCNEAADRIERDGSLERVFAHHALWLGGFDGSVTPSGYVWWNRAHPSDHMVLVGSQSGWPAIESRATPTFYFFEGSHVKRVIIGWASKQMLLNLRLAACDIGLCT